MVTFSYRVVESVGIYRWQLIDPNGNVLSEGVADTRPRAVAHALQSYLDAFEQQGESKAVSREPKQPET